MVRSIGDIIVPINGTVWTPLDAISTRVNLT